MAPIWDELGKKYDDNNDVIVAMMDATMNELEDIKIQGFPTVKLFKKGDNKVNTINYACHQTGSNQLSFNPGN